MKGTQIAMNCDNADFLIIDYLDGKLTQDTSEELESHLDQCSRCRRELESTSLLLEQINTLPPEEPPAEIRSFFYKMLEEEKQAEPISPELLKSTEKPGGRKSLQPAWFVWSMRIAAGMALFLAGWISQNNLDLLQDNPDKVNPGTALTENVKNSGPLSNAIGTSIDNVSTKQGDDDLKTTDIPGLFKKLPLASRRIQFISDMDNSQLDRQDYLAILFDRLNFDTNVNVRLTALHALSRHLDEPLVRTGLFESLTMQDDPFIQVMLVDVLAQLKDDRILPEMNRLMRDDETHQDVKREIKKRMVDFL